jgi:hypothetical protein
MKEKAMKKLFMILCIVIMIFGIVGCPSSDDQGNTFSQSSISSSNSTTPTASSEKIDPGYIDGSNGGASAVPEPATLILLGSGLLGLAVVGRKKFFKKD